MCDRYRQNILCPVEWNRRFYEEYLHQHAAMTQWVQQLNYNASSSNHSVYQSVPFNAHQQNFNFYTLPNESNSIYHHYPEHHGNHFRYENPSIQVHHSYPSVSYKNCTDVPHHQNHHFPPNREEVNIADDFISEDGIVEADRDDIIGSDDEICFNFESIAVLREKKDTPSETSEKNDASSEHDSDDFELLDTVPNVEFEYVHLDKFGNMEKVIVGEPDTANEVEKEREKKICLYGEKATTLGGLETAVALDFNRHCDLYQPTLWPVLPLRL